MKLIRFGEPGHERPGAVDRDGVLRDLSGVSGDVAGEGLSPPHLEKLRTVELASLPRVAPSVRLGPCVGGTRNFIAVALNYADHAAETGAAIPGEPILFNKAPSCIVGSADDLHIPTGSTKTDWEVELAVVIGSPAYRVDERDARQAIAGFCVCHDVSERALRLERGGQWTKRKGCPTFGPVGPWLVTPTRLPTFSGFRCGSM